MIPLLAFGFYSNSFAKKRLPDKRAFAIYTISAPKIDGKVDKVWFRAPVQKGFLQRTPRQGEKASNDTRFYVLYDLKNIYFLFVMIDRDSRSIPARLVDRDHEFYPDDNINFYLDTYNDTRKAFYFSTNPRGVEQDGLISENGTNVDMTWDGIFKVAARRNRYGWVAEFAIPYKTLRFEDNLRYQIWGFNVWRVRKKSREESYWSLVDQNYLPFRLDRGGVLIGMKNVQSGHHLNLLPYTTAKHNKSFGSNQTVDFNAGLDLKYNITSDLTLDLTANPDFGQVEIDEEQINLDKRFEVQLEEKRPFFLESTNLFQSPFYQLFYSRRIGALNDIKAGTKLTGRIGSYSFGALGALTGGWENFGLGDPDVPPTDELFSVFRLQKDVLASSNVGMMIVDREANLRGKHHGSNRVGSADWSIQHGQNYFIGQAVYSQNTDYFSQLNSFEKTSGGALYSQVGHYGRLFWFDLHAHYYQPDFGVDSTGYFPKLPGKGQKQVGLYSEIHPLINRRFLRSWGFGLKPTVLQDSDESSPGFGIQGTFWLEAPDQSMVKIAFTSYRDVETNLFNPADELNYWGRDISAELSTDPGKNVSLKLKWNFDSQYYFQTHTTGYNEGAEAELKIKPNSNSNLDFGFKRRWFFDRDRVRMPVARIGQSDVKISTVRGRYLFTREIFARGFLQFTNGAELPSFVFLPTEQRYQLYYDVWNRLSANVLFGWRFLPGSTLYLAYTQEWEDNLTRQLASTNRVFFFKLSYLWSL